MSAAYTKLRSGALEPGPYVGFYFGSGLKIRGGERRGPKGRSPRPERPRSGMGTWGSWWGGSQPPPHQLGSMVSAVSSPARSGAEPRPPQWFVAFCERQTAFPGISKASGQAPEATYYGACNFYTVKNVLVIISGGGWTHKPLEPHCNSLPRVLWEIVSCRPLSVHLLCESVATCSSISNTKRPIHCTYTRDS